MIARAVQPGVRRAYEMKRLWIVPACIAVMVMIGYDQMDIRSESYLTRDDAIRGGALERGWIPEGMLPPTASDIRLLSNTDTNELILGFRYQNGDMEKSPANCAPEVVAQISRPRESLARRAAWWEFGFLAGAPRARRYFKCERRSHTGSATAGWLAIRDEDRRAFYWE